MLKTNKWKSNDKIRKAWLETAEKRGLEQAAGEGRGERKITDQKEGGEKGKPRARKTGEGCTPIHEAWPQLFKRSNLYKGPAPHLPSSTHSRRASIYYTS